MAKVYIVIPTYNNFSLTHNLLWQLNRKEKENITSVLVVNNGSNDNEETENGLKWWSESKVGLPVQVLNLPENIHFLRCANAGMKDLTSKSNDDDILILLSNDVLVNGKFISQICDIINGNSLAVVGGILYQNDTGWNNLGNHIYPYLEGWLLATTVENWKKLEYFDERFAPCDFEDIHLSTKALSMGMKLIPLNNVGLVHKGGATIGYNEERLKNTKKNQEIFRKIWVEQTLPNSIDSKNQDL